MMGTPATIKIEGVAEIDIVHISCVCKFCRESGSEGARIELNFADQKIYYKCNKCSKMNILNLSKDPSVPYPKSYLGR